MSETAVFIKTCSGRPSLLWTINSVQFSLKDIDYRLYISDEAPIDKWKKHLYDNLIKDGHYVEIQDAGIACGIARNSLLGAMQGEKYILRMDDDFELGGEFNYSSLVQILESNDEIGFVSDFERQIGRNKGVYSGVLRPGGGRVILKSNKIIKRFDSPFVKYDKVKGVRFKRADFTRNLLLIKRQVFDKISWDEDLLFKGEHLDFMLSIKNAGWSGAYTPDSIHQHRDDLKQFVDSDISVDQTINNKRYYSVFKSKWGVSIVKVHYPILWYFVEFVRRIGVKLY